LEIYFLFMYADGSVTPSEKQYLDEIIAKGEISSWEKEEFQAFCGRTVLKILAPTADTIIAEIDQVLGEKETWRSSLDGNKAMQAQTIWTLINLGYADDEYSEPERAVVAHLVERWEMDPELVAELNDTADTILALTKQKQWIQTIPKPSAEVNRTIQELDRSIEAMFANVETIIAEADIAAPVPANAEKSNAEKSRKISEENIGSALGAALASATGANAAVADAVTAGFTAGFAAGVAEKMRR
jgi:hypothetical protein